ncbi:MAG: hypothetical protein L0Y44_13675 [Phycisphaerales bacterium]|nr:hypothetical protein [Phycisphaerales bacterium]MCI0631694.1 hypothetical protein [Phycisphaerales bacterium]MCI0674771.1 hypothetical protein [Phycisphaerales bacterium]
MTIAIAIFVALCAVVGVVLAALIARLGWQLHQSEGRLTKARCPYCTYPLRFDGVQHWCSECGYKHPVSKDGNTDSAPLRLNSPEK